MPSSTSNSETEAQRAEGRRFTLSALLWGAALLAVYSAWFVWAQPQVNTFQNYSARNVNRAEHFLHADRERAVLVGSSLAQIVPPEALGDEVYNMGFSRESSLTGLSLAARAPRPPEIVVIEVNYILREVNQSFVDDRLSPMGYALKDAVPVFRIAGQPMNILLSVLRGGYGRSNAQKMADTVDTARLQTLVARRVSDFQSPPSPEALEAAVATLRGQVDTLVRRGSVPIMLLMPVEPALEETPYALAVRAALERTFPPERYPWVDTTRDAPYRTTDSEHLLFIDAWDVGERIAKAVAAVPLTERSAEAP